MLVFAGIGAQKAGTTWLYDQLRRHPDVAFPAGKEVHYWDQKTENGIGWYRSLFETQETKEKSCGEITPAYAILPVELIRQCRENFPRLKLVYIMRNPIERAWSSARMALDRAEMKIDEASESWFLDHFKSQGSLLRGDYEQCLRNWLSVYPQEQLMTAFFEELVENPTNLLKRCFDHLGVSSERYNWDADLAKKVRGGEEAALPETLRSRLREIYSPQIESLESLLGVDLSSWQ